jgi:F-type H+-transporting ATPase subunit a
MIRLYATFFAGHIVLMSIIGLNLFSRAGWEAHYHLDCHLLSILEILVAFLQAYIFTLLSALYFGCSRRASPRGGTLIN